MLSWIWSEPLPAGTIAPSFSLPDEQGRIATLDQHRGKQNVVLVFYPADDTPVCTKQACEFRDDWASVSSANTVVYGINTRSAESHRRFREKHRLPFSLLVDKGQRVAKLYNTNGPIIKRTVYLIGKDGRIKFAQRGKPTPSEVLKFAE